MKTKPITFILSLTFLFLFGGFVYGEEPEVKREYYDSGKLRIEIYYKIKIKEELGTKWYESGVKEMKIPYKNEKLKRLGSVWLKSCIS